MCIRDSVSDDGEGKDAFLSTTRLQMQHAVLDRLRAALIPELGADIATGAAGNVQLVLVAVAALEMCIRDREQAGGRGRRAVHRGHHGFLRAVSGGLQVGCQRLPACLLYTSIRDTEDIFDVVEVLFERYE